MRLRPHTFLAALSLAAAALPATAAGDNPRPLAFSPGEVLTYDARYLGATVGQVTAAVGAATEVAGQKVWPILGAARTESFFAFLPVKDRFVTWWDPESGSTVGSDFQADHNHWRRHERIRYDRKEQTTASFVCEKEGMPTFAETVDVPPDSRDIVAAIFTLRQRRLAVGDHEEIPVFTGKRAFVLKLDVLRTETAEVKAGEFDAVVAAVQVEFSGKLATKQMSIVFSNDARHLPVRFDAEFAFGRLVVELRSFERGVSLP